MNRIILTSAKMDLLVNKWFSLSEKDRRMRTVLNQMIIMIWKVILEKLSISVF